MKILVLTFYYEPDLCAGSFRAAAFVNAFAQLLGDNDSIDVVTTMPNRYHSFYKKALAYENRGNVHIRRITLPDHKSGMLDQSRVFVSYALSTRLYVADSNYDLIFATSSRLFTAFLGALLARKKKTKLYLDIRDIFTDTIQDILKSRLRKLLLPAILMIEKYTINSACKVNLVSAGFEDYFCSVAPNKAYTFFTNGIDDEFLDFDFSKDEHSGRDIILYAGNIGEGQGLERIIPYIAKSLEKTCEFWVIGEGGTKTKLEKALMENCVQNVTLIKPVDRKELLKLYAKSDYLFMHLNDYNAFKKVLPSKIFEYAATGKPIIAGVAGYAKKFIELNVQNAAVFDPCDSKDFLKKIAILHSNVMPRKAFIDKYKRKNIMSRMSKDVMACIESMDCNAN